MSPRTPPLAVWLRGEPVAELVEVRSRQLRLRYLPVAVERWGNGAVVLSASLPVRPAPYSVGSTRPFIEGLLPEGEFRTAVERTFDVPRGDVARLLAAIGADCAGAVQVLPDGERPVDDLGGTEPLDAGGLEEALAALPQQPLGVGHGVRLSLAGRQDKLLLARRPDGSWARPVGGAPSTHLLKPQPDTFPGLVQLEAFGLAFARHLGADTASAEVLEVAGRPVLSVARYDRHVGADGRVVRTHQEDFCQACGRLPDEKHQADGGPGWRDIAAVVRAVAADPRAELLALARALLTTVLVGNADAHARNFSLLHTEGGSRLAPLYDVVPTLHLARTPGAAPLERRTAMSVNGRWDADGVDRGDVLAEFSSWPLPTRAVERLLDEVLERALEPSVATLTGARKDVITAIAARADRLAGSPRS
ncbi:HipA domain-containing protein [Kineococcus esterisolvens]|uniref:HipA domain-containing protein n=1 Tax=unclassified Kineococcus TaxID=2621656 RepID=UPI003D7CC0CF